MNHKKIKRKIILDELRVLFKTKEFFNIYISEDSQEFRYNDNLTVIKIQWGEGAGFSIKIKLTYNNKNSSNYDDYILISPLNLILYFKIYKFTENQIKISDNERFIRSLKGLPETVKTKLNMNIL